MKQDIIARLESNIVRNPDAVQPYVELAQVLCSHDDVDRGIDLLHKAEELEPGNLAVLFMLAVAYEKLEMYDHAISTWEAKIRAGGDMVTSYIFMIRCFCKMNDKQSALKTYHLLKEINPEQAERTFNMIDDIRCD